ncbi:CPBP family glutamic-type intramembrane protease [Cellulomonas bogoriensis]|uniref:Membrane protein n=1 Tax=Cellulomonas bogoriensis 69B4 = DSM 16987 TaxID=1386082 RepID=A0A0A0C037_9CELL|nr:CPBP family glutamic-type intramembrane protease [Cellulomonas bogoriensis]KGM13560.1 membrane protein [Cellulomonas bogoriensis 69B4 = DSM 16987]
MSYQGDGPDVVSDEDTRHRDHAAAWSRALLAGLVAAVGIAAGIILGGALTSAVGLTGLPADLVSVVLVSALVLGLVHLARGRRTWHDLGLTGNRSTLVGVGTGFAAVAACAAVVLGPATAAGLVTWGPLDPGRVVVFLAVNTVLALLLEAFPEELALRGLAWTALRERYGPHLTAAATTAVFLVTAVLASVLITLPQALAGGQVRLSPVGEDPVAYLVLVTVLGLALGYARGATRVLTLGTAVGVHLGYLTVVRLTFAGAERDAGWSMTPATEGAVLVIPGFLVLAAVLLAALGARARRRRP